MATTLLNHVPAEFNAQESSYDYNRISAAYARFSKSLSRSKFWGRNAKDPQNEVREKLKTPQSLRRCNSEHGTNASVGKDQAPQGVKRTNTAPVGKCRGEIEPLNRPLVILGESAVKEKKPSDRNRIEPFDGPLIDLDASTKHSESGKSNPSKVVRGDDRNLLKLTGRHYATVSKGFQLECHNLQTGCNKTTHYTDKLNKICKHKLCIPWQNVNSVPGDGNCYR